MTVPAITKASPNASSNAEAVPRHAVGQKNEGFRAFCRSGEAALEGPKAVDAGQLLPAGFPVAMVPKARNLLLTADA